MEAKLDSLLQLLQNSEARMSQEMQSIKLAIDAMGLAARTPTRCSTDGPSRDASELRSPSDPATAPVAPTATVVVPELAATAAIDAALDGDATSSAASMPDTCSTDGLHRGTCEDSSVEVSMLSETTQPWQSSFVLEFDIMAPTRCLKHIPKEVTFELMPVTMACSVLSPSPAINESDSVSPYAESPPLLPAPLPKPPWLLLVHEPVAGHVLPTLVFAGALHGFKGETATSVMTRGFQMGVVSADFQGWLLLVGNIWEWSRLLESVNLHGCTVMFVEQRSWNYMLAQVELKLWSSWRSYSMVKLSILLDSTRSVRWLISPWDPGEKKIKSNKHGSLLELQEVTLFPSTRSKNAEVQSATKLMYTSVQWQFLKKEESKVNRNLAVQLAAETFLLCNDAEEDLAHILSDKLLQHDKFWWQPCYPPFVRVDHNQMEHVLAKAIAVDQVQSGSCSIGYVTQGSVLALYICKTQIRCTFSLQQVHDRVKLFAQTVRDSLCKWNCTGYQGCSVNCCLLWASEREKLLFYSAYEQVHCRLQSKTAEMHQHITQPGKNLLLFLQPKPPWLSILTQVYAVIEEREVYTHGEVMTLNSKIILAAPEPYVQQLIGECFLRIFYREERYSSCVMLLSEIKIQDDTSGILMDHHNRVGSGVLGTWSTYKLLPGGISSTSRHSHISKVGIPIATTLIFWQSMVLLDITNPHGRSPWDPGGCMLAWYSCEKRWNTSKTTALHCSDQFWWLSLLLAYASRIWLVAWLSLKLSFGYEQAPSQEGRNVMTLAVISDSDHVGHNYYIAFVNKISIGHNHCSNQGYSFYTISSDLIYYNEDDHRNNGNITEVHAPWDRGKLALVILRRHQPLDFLGRSRLGDKPSFKKGGMS